MSRIGLGSIDEGLTFDAAPGPAVRLRWVWSLDEKPSLLHFILALVLVIPVLILSGLLAHLQGVPAGTFSFSVPLVVPLFSTVLAEYLLQRLTMNISILCML